MAQNQQKNEVSDDEIQFSEKVDFHHISVAKSHFKQKRNLDRKSAPEPFLKNSIDDEQDFQEISLHLKNQCASHRVNIGNIKMKNRTRNPSIIPNTTNLARKYEKLTFEEK